MSENKSLFRTFEEKKNERKIGFLTAMESGSVVAVEARDNRHVIGFIEECMVEAKMVPPIVINCEFVPSVENLFATLETEPDMIQKNYILENIENKEWALDAMEKCIEYTKNKGYKIVIILKERQDNIEESYSIKLNGKPIFYPEMEGYMMATADQKAVAYFGHITPQNYYEALKIIMQEGPKEGRGMSRIPAMQYELGLSMRDKRNIEDLRTREQAVLFIKACNRTTMANNYTRKELATILNVLKPLGKDTVFKGVMCKARAVQHIENFMKIHNRKWEL